MDVRERRLTIPGVLEQIRTACEFVAEAAQNAGLDDDGVHHCYLCVEEICTNIVEHGYGHNGANKTIEIVCQQSYPFFTIVIIDEAPQFNPLELPEPDPGTPLWEREAGGWGIYFVKKYMDAVRYRYANYRNHLMMDKRMG
jgi:anti-sigma regulatory factor (Ser/Thr protein kinase)